MCLLRLDHKRHCGFFLTLSWITHSWGSWGFFGLFFFWFFRVMFQECLRLLPFPWDAEGHRNQSHVFSTLSQPLYLRLQGLAEGEEILVILGEQTG